MPSSLSPARSCIYQPSVSKKFHFRSVLYVSLSLSSYKMPQPPSPNNKPSFGPIVSSPSACLVSLSSPLAPFRRCDKSPCDPCVLDFSLFLSPLFVLPRARLVFVRATRLCTLRSATPPPA